MGRKQSPEATQAAEACPPPPRVADSEGVRDEGEDGDGESVQGRCSPTCLPLLVFVTRQRLLTGAKAGEGRCRYRSLQ